MYQVKKGLHAFIITVGFFLSDIAIDLVYQWSIIFQKTKKKNEQKNLTPQHHDNPHFKKHYFLLECHEVVIRLLEKPYFSPLRINSNFE